MRKISFAMFGGWVVALSLSGCLPAHPPLPTVMPTFPPPTAPTPTPIPVTDTPTPSPSHTPAPKYITALPDPSTFTWVPVVNGLKSAVDIQNAGDGSGRLFIMEKAGRILILQNGLLLAEPFLDISFEVGSGASEQGLLGLAFHPGYSQNGIFLVNYTDLEGNTVLAQFSVLPGDPNRADPASELDLMHIQQPYANHNGGGLAFGPDGYLYIGLGDGGSGGDPHRNAQNLDSLLGKILRIEIIPGQGYGIPPGNPYLAGGGLAEIWAVGLRNPWRFSFDRVTGELYIGDVGQSDWEEINYVPADLPGGLNFGWSLFEGVHPYQDTPPEGRTYIPPVVEYSHQSGCSVTGGMVYRGSQLPELAGVYLYGDFCSGNIWGLIHTGEGTWESGLLFSTRMAISTFGVNDSGEVFLVDYGSGKLMQLTRR